MRESLGLQQLLDVSEHSTGLLWVSSLKAVLAAAVAAQAWLLPKLKSFKLLIMLIINASLAEWILVLRQKV